MHSIENKVNLVCYLSVFEPFLISAQTGDADLGIGNMMKIAGAV